MQALKEQNKSIEEIYKYTNEIIFEEDEDQEDSEEDFYQNSPKAAKKKTPVRNKYSSLDARPIRDRQSESALASYSNQPTTAQEMTRNKANKPASIISGAASEKNRQVLNQSMEVLPSKSRSITNMSDDHSEASAGSMPPIESRSIDVNLYGQDDHRKYKKPPIRLPSQKERNNGLPTIGGSSRFSDSHSKYQNNQNPGSSGIYKNAVKQKMILDAQRNGSRRSMKEAQPENAYGVLDPDEYERANQSMEQIDNNSLLN